VTRRRAIHVVVAVLAGLTASCVADPSGPYLGQTPPGTTAELFAPGLLSTALHDDGPAKFNADGTEVYFRKWAVPHDIVGVMRLENGRWTAPELFKPMGRYVASAPVFAPDGLTRYYISRRPLEGDGEPADYNIWSSEKVSDGWSEPVPLGPEVNSPEDELLWSVSSRGTLYFQANRDDSHGGFDLYAQRSADGVYLPPENMGAPLNTEHTEAAPAVAPDESFVVYCARGYPDGHGGLDLYVSFRQSDGSWSAGLNLGPGVNTPANEKFPSVTLDGRYLFFVGDGGAERSYVYSDMTYEEAMTRNLGPMNGRGDVYWVDTEVIHVLR